MNRRLFTKRIITNSSICKKIYLKKYMKPLKLTFIMNYKLLRPD